MRGKRILVILDCRNNYANDNNNRNFAKNYTTIIALMTTT